VQLNKAEHVMIIPESVIEWVGDSTYVYCLTDSLPKQKFERRAITTGLSNGIDIEVKSGIDKTTKLRGKEITNNTDKE
jgi:HlyD family secretion protein